MIDWWFHCGYKKQHIDEGEKPKHKTFYKYKICR